MYINFEKMDPKIAFTNMLCNGVIMDVMNVEQAKIAEDAGAVAVMALERVPALIIREGGIARASDPVMIKKIQEAVSIPVMAKCRIGHISEAKILEALEVDCIDESEVLTIADKEDHIDKIKFSIPFVCGCRNLAEALRRIEEGAALIRCKGQAGTGDVAEAVYHLKAVKREIHNLKGLDSSQIKIKAQEMRIQESLLNKVCIDQKLPVPFFAAGGIVTPADAALCMELGSESVFVGSGIFLSEDPVKRAKAIVEAINHWKDPKKLAEISEDLGESMR
jgi:pyridoxal 5'-phosphate synthase pdxS subunit